MKILITGTHGFVGTNLIEAFSGEHQIIRWDVRSHETLPEVDAVIHLAAKVHDTRTFVDELQYTKDQFGVYIDIFPIDGVGEDEQVLRILRWRKLLHTKKANYYQRTLTKKIINTFGKIILLPFSTHDILKRMDKEARRFPYGSTSKAGIIINPYGTREIVDISVFDHAIPKEFEGKDYMVPVGYDTWLRSIYSDYMQFPPEDKRHSPHVAVAYWK